MKFTAIILAVAALFAAGDACKCLRDSNIKYRDTRDCCERAGGDWDGQDECARSTVRTFNDCCGLHNNTSDC